MVAKLLQGLLLLGGIVLTGYASFQGQMPQGNNTVNKYISTKNDLETLKEVRYDLKSKLSKEVTPEGSSALSSLEEKITELNHEKKELESTPRIQAYEDASKEYHSWGTLWATGLLCTLVGGVWKYESSRDPYFD